MRKITVLFTLFLIFGVGIYLDRADSTENLSELQLANIEALASGESGVSNTGQEKKKNAMVVDIKWYVVALILVHVLTVIVFKLITVLVSVIQTKNLLAWFGYIKRVDGEGFSLVNEIFAGD